MNDVANQTKTKAWQPSETQLDLDSICMPVLTSTPRKESPDLTLIK